MPSSTSDLEIFMGGAKRITLPYRPPLPINRPLARARSINCIGFHRRGLFGLPVADQFERLHHAHAANVADQRILFLELLQLLAEVAANDMRVFKQFLLFDHFDHGARGDGRHRISAESRNRQARNFSASSAVVIVAPTGTPLAMLFAQVMMSGVTSHCSMPNHFLPVRPKPVCTSSEINSPP